MKIIKKGTKTPPCDQVYVIKCHTCGCKFTYMEEDIEWIALGKSVITCPQCSYYIATPLIKRKYHRKWYPMLISENQDNKKEDVI